MKKDHIKTSLYGIPLTTIFALSAYTEWFDDMFKLFIGFLFLTFLFLGINYVFGQAVKMIIEMIKTNK